VGILAASKINTVKSSHGFLKSPKSSKLQQKKGSSKVKRALFGVKAAGETRKVLTKLDSMTSRDGGVVSPREYNAKPSMLLKRKPQRGSTQHVAKKTSSASIDYKKTISRTNGTNAATTLEMIDSRQVKGLFMKEGKHERHGGRRAAGTLAGRANDSLPK